MSLEEDEMMDGLHYLREEEDGLHYLREKKAF